MPRRGSLRRRRADTPASFQHQRQLRFFHFRMRALSSILQAHNVFRLSMLSSSRSSVLAFAIHIGRVHVRPFSTSRCRQRQGPGSGENFIQANDPTPRKETPNASKTNETAVTASGAQDSSLQETAADAEKKRQLQAPNRAEIWSRSQMPRERAMSGPRFEQTIMELQVSRTGDG